MAKLFQLWCVDSQFGNPDVQAIQHAYYDVQQFINPEPLSFPAHWLYWIDAWNQKPKTNQMINFTYKALLAFLSQRLTVQRRGMSLFCLQVESLAFEFYPKRSSMFDKSEVQISLLVLETSQHKVHLVAVFLELLVILIILRMLSQHSHYCY